MRLHQRTSFSILSFLPDSWRILTGILLSLLFTPHILPPDISMAGRALLYVMVACIGWALSSKPAHLLTDRLKKIVLVKKG